MTTEDTTRSINSSAARFFSGTVFSRITGMGRDLVMAATFGSHPSVAAFMMAYRFANLLRRILGEGALQSAFIPHFESLRSTSEINAATFFRDLLLSLCIILCGIILLVETGLIGCSFLFTFSPNTQEVITNTALIFPAILFICLYGLNSSLLQCERYYFLPSAAPAAFNCVWIAGILLLRTMPPSRAMRLLSLFIVFAFLIQWLITLPKTMRIIRRHTSLRKKPHPFSPAVISMTSALSLGIIGITATQINSGLDALFARSADLRGPAYLWYAIRVQQLPLALFSIGMLQALMPPLSRAAKTGDMDSYRRFLRHAIKQTTLIIIPCSIFLIIAGKLAITILYGHGHFDTSSITHTTHCLQAYSLGLPPMSLSFLLSSAYYARNNYKTPAIITVITVITNIALNSLFVFKLNMGATSVALATSICAYLNASLLLLGGLRPSKTPCQRA